MITFEAAVKEKLIESYLIANIIHNLWVFVLLDILI